MSKLISLEMRSFLFFIGTLFCLLIYQICVVWSENILKGLFCIIQMILISLSIGVLKGNSSLDIGDIIAFECIWMLFLLFFHYDGRRNIYSMVRNSSFFPLIMLGIGGTSESRRVEIKNIIHEIFSPSNKYKGLTVIARRDNQLQIDLFLHVNRKKPMNDDAIIDDHWDSIEEIRGGKHVTRRIDLQQDNVSTQKKMSRAVVFAVLIIAFLIFFIVIDRSGKYLFFKSMGVINAYILCDCIHAVMCTQNFKMFLRKIIMSAAVVIMAILVILYM